MQTIWLSPTDFVTGDPSLRISYPFVSHPSTIITCTAPGDFKWVSMGLRLPPNVAIQEVIVCYQVTNNCYGIVDNTGYPAIVLVVAIPPPFARLRRGMQRGRYGRCYF